MPISPSRKIVVKRVPRKGRGVFAVHDIAEGDEIERVPMLVLPLAEVQGIPNSGVLGNYAFSWGERGDKVAIALGFGSVYNHAFDPNAMYRDLPGQQKVFVARRDIGAGEEITINYNGDPDDKTPVDFLVVE